MRFRSAGVVGLVVLLMPLTGCESGGAEASDATSLGASTKALDEAIEGDDMRVISFNIGHGRRDCCGAMEACVVEGTRSCNSGYCRNPVRVMEGIVEFLKGLRDTAPRRAWNVLALQEVDVGASRSCHVDQAWEIDESFGQYDGVDPLSGYANTKATTIEHDSGGSYGLAVVANHPLDDVREIVLRHPSTEGAICSSDSPSDLETRKAMILPMTQASVPIWVINTHFSYEGVPCGEPAPDASIVQCQADRVASYVASQIPRDDIVVLVGDLNVALFGENDGAISCARRTGWIQLHTALSNAGFRRVELDGHTAPAHVPTSTIDYAFVRDPLFRLSTISAHVEAPTWSHPEGSGMLSDHRAIVVDMVWQPGRLSPLLVPVLSTAL
jgi:endonuclease/exonuclease/phosphatase family metal-dependent hydrolase